MPAWPEALLSPITKIITKRQERKSAREAAKAKLLQAVQDDAHVLNLNKDEWEQLADQGLDHSWKDEYVTVSVVSIFNLIVAAV